MDQAFIDIIRTAIWPATAIIVAFILREPLIKLFQLPNTYATASSSPGQTAAVAQGVTASDVDIRAASGLSESQALDSLFWRFYAFMYDSQLQALRFIKQRGDVTEAELQPYYVLALSRGLVGATFEVWLTYLVSFGLITREPRGDGNWIIRLTNRGRQFLDWADRQLLPNAPRVI